MAKSYIDFHVHSLTLGHWWKPTCEVGTRLCMWLRYLLLFHLIYFNWYGSGWIRWYALPITIDHFKCTDATSSKFTYRSSIIKFRLEHECLMFCIKCIWEVTRNSFSTMIGLCTDKQNLFSKTLDLRFSWVVHISNSVYVLRHTSKIWWFVCEFYVFITVLKVCMGRV